MKAAKTKIASNSHKPETPFFQKEYGGHFFAKDTAPDLFFPSANKPIQPKLTIGAPDDKYEKEADAVADEVVQRTEEENIQKKEADHSQSNQERSVDNSKHETNHVAKNLASNGPLLFFRQSSPSGSPMTNTKRKPILLQMPSCMIRE